MTSVTSSLHETPNYDIIRPAAPPPPELAEPALSSTPRSAAHHPTVAVPFIRSPIPTRPFHVGFKRKADFDGEEVQQDQQTHKRVKWDASGSHHGPLSTENAANPSEFMSCDAAVAPPTFSDIDRRRSENPAQQGISPETGFLSSEEATFFFSQLDSSIANQIGSEDFDMDAAVSAILSLPGFQMLRSTQPHSDMDNDPSQSVPNPAEVVQDTFFDTTGDKDEDEHDDIDVDLDAEVDSCPGDKWIWKRACKSRMGQLFYLYGKPAVFKAIRRELNPDATPDMSQAQPHPSNEDGESEIGVDSEADTTADTRAGEVAAHSEPLQLEIYTPSDFDAWLASRRNSEHTSDSTEDGAMSASLPSTPELDATEDTRFGPPDDTHDNSSEPLSHDVSFVYQSYDDPPTPRPDSTDDSDSESQSGSGSDSESESDSGDNDTDLLPVPIPLPTPTLPGRSGAPSPDQGTAHAYAPLTALPRLSSLPALDPSLHDYPAPVARGTPPRVDEDAKGVLLRRPAMPAVR
ncbi:hypothetical protein AcW1_008524 [Taiwanofungus camphoratus]|nr:hypothetical protein AcW1_008524 [Antrodia cinnamomea]